MKYRVNYPWLDPPRQGFDGILQGLPGFIAIGVDQVGKCLSQPLVWCFPGIYVLHSSSITTRRSLPLESLCS